jgi:hypothetical protein
MEMVRMEAVWKAEVTVQGKVPVKGGQTPPGWCLFALDGLWHWVRAVNDHVDG